MLNLPTLYEVGIMLPGIILGLTLHELAHGWTADRLGDHTARYQGRLTLNPLAHVDIIGLILLFVAGFGWAKPVPVNPYNFRGDVRRGMMLVSLAGP
ncbi:MAG TPA: site-2 protease family protein, partial [Desulfotomaculum sp.]|nr:site-2 protease family protein [Desulfotomaculum sp.]